MCAAYFAEPRSCNAAWHVDCPPPTCSCHCAPHPNRPSSLPWHSGARPFAYGFPQFACISHTFSPLWQCPRPPPLPFWHALVACYIFQFVNISCGASTESRQKSAALVHRCLAPGPQPQPTSQGSPGRRQCRRMKCICFICWACFPCQLNVY